MQVAMNTSHLLNKDFAPTSLHKNINVTLVPPNVMMNMGLCVDVESTIK